jgi:ABC-type nickel/cobalt efflux system permease component RcnA
MLSTSALIVICFLLWFIWRALDTIAANLGKLHTLALERHMQRQR